MDLSIMVVGSESSTYQRLIVFVFKPIYLQNTTEKQGLHAVHGCPHAQAPGPLLSCTGSILRGFLLVRSTSSDCNTLTPVSLLPWSLRMVI